MNAPLRHFVSPYARRLAGERGLQLADIRGSGPAGRIVAADVLSFSKTPANAAVTVPASASVPVTMLSAIAAQVDLGAVQALAAQFADAHLPLPVDALLVRAAGRNLALLGMPGPIGWEAGRGPDRGEIQIADSGSLSLAAIQSQIDAASRKSEHPALLSIRRFEKSGLLAVSMPLLAGHSARLIVAMQGESRADCLLCFDAAGTDEDGALAFLAQFRDDLEQPLRLLA